MWNANIRGSEHLKKTATTSQYYRFVPYLYCFEVKPYIVAQSYFNFTCCCAIYTGTKLLAYNNRIKRKSVIFFSGKLGTIAIVKNSFKVIF